MHGDNLASRNKGKIPLGSGVRSKHPYLNPLLPGIRYMQSKTWAKILTDSENGGALLLRARQLLRLRELADAILPHSLRGAYSLASLKPGEAVLFIAANSAIASKIRLFDLKLRESFARNGFHIEKIRVEIDPAAVPASPDKPKSAQLSPAASVCLDRLADKLPDDSPVATAARTIASRSRES